MPDYKEMYLALFRKTSKAIELLQQALLEAEELYLEHEQPELLLLARSDSADER